MDDEVFMTRSANITRKTTEQNLIVRSDKSEAAITKNKVILLKLTRQIRSIARPLCESRATCYHCSYHYYSIN